MKLIFRHLLFFAVLANTEGIAQKFTPKWYGRAETKTSFANNSYLCELLLTKKGNQVTGTLNYFFGQKEYLVKISGLYWPQTRTIELNPFNLVTYFASDAYAPDCQVDGSLTLYTERGDSILYGQLNPVEKYRNMCPVLTIMLQKEIISDPGPDPDLPAIVENQVKKMDSVITSEIILPSEVILEQAQSDTFRNTPVQPSIKTQSALNPEVLALTAPQVSNRETNLQTAVLTKRTFQPGPLIMVATDTITLHLYDNGQVDNDSVTVFFNRKPVVEKQRLSISPIIVKVVLEPGENEIAMYAENLGYIPPNTALCLIYSGDKRYEINLVSNLASNGTIRLKKAPN